ncbi:pas sensor protein [Flammeovirgaceae bacterium 311]|nr:pas sensor protein [Flammeovirgaceae bacterium 311]
MLSILKTVLRLNSIKGNIILALIAMGTFTLLLTVSNYWISDQLNYSQNTLNTVLSPAQSSLKSISTDLNKSVLQINLYLDTEKEAHLVEWNALWQKSLENSISKVVEINTTTVHHQNKNDIAALDLQLKDIYQEQQQLLAAVQQQITTARNLPDTAGATISLAPFKSALVKNTEKVNTKAETLITLLITRIDQMIADEQAKQQQYLLYMKYIALCFLILCILAGTVIGYFLIVQVVSSLYRVKQTIKELSHGNIPDAIWQSSNETSHITKELGKLTDHLREVQHFAIQVGEGKFDNNIEVFNKQGALGSSLAGMRDSLYQVAQDDQQRNWVNEGFTLFGDIIRNNNSSINELCDVALSKLVKYVGANQGAIFVIQKSDTLEQEVLTMVSSYAYDRKKYLQKEILIGEGLCGQAWQEENIIHINDVPKEYVQVRSGLGGANPTEVLIVPLIANEQSQGVLELASFSSFKPYQVDFISKIAENLAAAVSTTKANEQTHLLLERFQELTEELRAQEEEMRQNMEELQATQEEMTRAKTLIERKEHNLNSVINNTPDTIFAIDQEYRITVVNKVLSDKYKGMGINLQEGTFISEILPKTAWEVWKPRYDRALAGEQFSIVQETSGSAGNRYSQTYHNPIRNEEGRVVGVSVISRDVTETVLAQQEAEYKRFIVNSLIDNTDDTYFAIDNNYKILIANKTLKDRYAQSNISLQEGENIFDKLPPDQHASWKERYDRALAGESFVMVTERPLKDKVLTIEVHHHPIVDSTTGKVIGAIVASKDITRWQQALAGNDKL